MADPADLPPPYAFAIGERVKGPNILGIVIMQISPRSVTIQQDRGGRITIGTVLLSKA